MKFLIVLCAVVGLSLAAPQQTPKDLSSDLKEILALIPIEDMRVIARKYLQTDEEFQRVVAYLQGDDWAKLVAAVKNNPTWVSFKVYLTEAGVDVEAIVQWIHDLITGAGTKTAVGPAPRGLRQFLDEVIAIIPKKEILALINDKLATSKDFQALFEKLSSPVAQALFEDVRAMEEVQRIAALLKAFGVDLDKVVAFIYAMLGWQ